MQTEEEAMKESIAFAEAQRQEEEQVKRALRLSLQEHQEREARKKLTEEYLARIRQMPFEEWLHELGSKQRDLAHARQVLSLKVNMVDEGELDPEQGTANQIFLLEQQIELLRTQRPDHIAAFSHWRQAQQKLAQQPQQQSTPTTEENNSEAEPQNGYMNIKQFNAFEKENRGQSTPTKQITGVPPFEVPRLKNEEEPIFQNFLGGGKFGMVFLAYWKGARVAIKVLPATTDEEPLLREVGTLYTLRHPNIVSFYHYMAGNSGHYIITEYVSGGTVRSKLDDPSFTFPSKLKCQMLIDVAAAMCFAHEHNVIHRDLRCDNLLLMPDCRFGFTVKVADFGLARVAGQHMSQLGAVGWTPDEVIEQDDYDLSFDVFSFGVVIYEILTRRRPESTESSPYFRILSPMPQDAPLKLWDLMTSCLLKEKERRPKFAQILKILFDIQARL